MKKFPFIVFLLLSVSLCAVAQDINTGIHEFGLNLSGPHTFGVRYRSGNENTLLRLTLLSADGSSQNTKAGSSSGKFGSFGVVFNIGFEKRKFISDNLGFYIGSDLLTSYTSNTNEYDNLAQKSKTWTVSGGVGLVLGFVYKITSDINVTAEVLPSIGYSYGKTTLNSNGVESSQTNTGITYGLSDTAANLTFSFRFGKKS